MLCSAARRQPGLRRRRADDDGAWDWANTAIFSVIDTVLLRLAPVEDIDALAVVWETDRNTSTTREPASLPTYLDYQQRSQRVSAIAAFAGSEKRTTCRRPVKRSGCRPCR